MMPLTRWMCPLLALLAAQSTDNREYQYWSPWKAGAWVRNRLEMENGSQKVEFETTTRLLEVSPERAVVETFRRLKESDRTVDSPPQKQVIRARDPDRGKIVAEKDEEVTVGGRTLKCHYFEIEALAQDQKSKVTVKAWMTKEIPGGIAKSEVTSDQLKGPVRTVALEWDAQ